MIFMISKTDINLRSPSMMSMTIIAMSKNLIYLIFILFKRCDILSVSLMELSLFDRDSRCHQSSSDLLESLCFISCRAVKISTMISIRSFVISSKSFMVSTVQPPSIHIFSSFL